MYDKSQFNAAVVDRYNLEQRGEFVLDHSDWLPRVRDGFALLNEAMIGYMESMGTRESQSLLSDALIAASLAGTQTYYDQFTERDSIRERTRNWHAHITGEIAEAKILNLNHLRVKRSRIQKLVKDMEAIAAVSPPGLGSPYMYAELLAQAVVGRAILGENYGAILRCVKIEFNDLGRWDRAAALQRAVWALPDWREFNKNFLYLLTS